MKVGIVGAGFIGRAVARAAVAHGHKVMLSNSRHPKTLGSAMVSIGCQIGTSAVAAEYGEIVLIAIPFGAIGDLDPAPFAGKIVMDANNYYPLRDGAIARLDSHEATTSEMLAAHLPGAKVVKCWNAILEKDIEADGRATAERRALPIAGDDVDAKRVVAGFVESLGFDVVDAGSLAEGWRFERARPAYCVPLDRVGLVAALSDADNKVDEGSWRASRAQ